MGHLADKWSIETGSQFEKPNAPTPLATKLYLLVIDRVHYRLLRVGLPHVRVIGLGAVTWIDIVL